MVVPAPVRCGFLCSRVNKVDELVMWACIVDRWHYSVAETCVCRNVFVVIVLLS